LGPSLATAFLSKSFKAVDDNHDDDNSWLQALFVVGATMVVGATTDVAIKSVFDQACDGKR